MKRDINSVEFKPTYPLNIQYNQTIWRSWLRQSLHNLTFFLTARVFAFNDHVPKQFTRPHGSNGRLAVIRLSTEGERNLEFCKKYRKVMGGICFIFWISRSGWMQSPVTYKTGRSILIWKWHLASSTFSFAHVSYMQLIVSDGLDILTLRVLLYYYRSFLFTRNPGFSFLRVTQPQDLT